MQNNQRNDSRTQTEYRYETPTCNSDRCTLYTIVGILATLALSYLAYVLGMSHGYEEGYRRVMEGAPSTTSGASVNPISEVNKQVQDTANAIASGVTTVTNAIATGATQVVDTLASGATQAVQAVDNAAEKTADIVSMDGVKMNNGYILLSKLSGDAKLWQEKTGNTLDANNFVVMDVSTPYVLLQTTTGDITGYEALKYDANTGVFTKIWSGKSLPSDPTECKILRDTHHLNTSFDLLQNCKF